VSPPPLSHLSVFVVLKPNTWTSNYGIVSIANDTESDWDNEDAIVILGDYADADKLSTLRGGVADRFEVNTEVVTRDAYHLYEVHIDFLTGAGEMVIDGASITDTTTAQDILAPTRIVLGARILSGAVDTFRGNADIGEIRVYTEGLTTDVIESIRMQLQTTWLI